MLFLPRLPVLMFLWSLSVETTTQTLDTPTTSLGMNHWVAATSGPGFSDLVHSLTVDSAHAI